jgi:hypothetical protein
MSESRPRRSMAILVGAVALGLLWAPVSASASCASVHIDYEPGWHALSCDNQSEETWTVPGPVVKPRFEVRGADDSIGGAGGLVEARLPLEAGDVITFRMGDEGAATSVSRGDELLLVAGGGDGVEPNFVAPEADLLGSQDPGGELGPTVDDGSIYVEWYEARDPFDLDEPLPPNSVEFPGAQVETFPYTGGWQDWAVPEGINRAAFELYGGAGSSGEPYGHVVAEFSVTPGENFWVSVGGPGGDTELRPGGFDAAVAAGGDTERPNYLPFGGVSKVAFWEGGGPDSQLGEGKALVHYWWQPEQEQGTPIPDPSLGPPEEPPITASELCVVPRLKDRTPRAARRRLAQASCGPVRIRRRATGMRMRGRVIHQHPSQGTAIPATKAIHLIVGR